MKTSYWWFILAVVAANIFCSVQNYPDEISWIAFLLLFIIYNQYEDGARIDAIYRAMYYREEEKDKDIS